MGGRQRGPRIDVAGRAEALGDVLQRDRLDLQAARAVVCQAHGWDPVRVSTAVNITWAAGGARDAFCGASGGRVSGVLVPQPASAARAAAMSRMGHSRGVPACRAEVSAARSARLAVCSSSMVIRSPVLRLRACWAHAARARASGSGAGTETGANSNRGGRRRLAVGYEADVLGGDATPRLGSTSRVPATRRSLTCGVVPEIERRSPHSAV